MAKRTSDISRRTFLKGAMGLAAAPLVLPATALGRGGRPAPSERIVMGGIGIGGRGGHDLNCLISEPDCQFVAVCDVRADRRLAVKTRIDQHNKASDCATYVDMRELLARPDIDAVLIAISDRWHTLASVLAMKAGKDVYCEKPCSVNLYESRALADTARIYGRVYQAGTQRRSEEPFVFIVQLARMGYLGKIHTLTAHIVHGFARPIWLPAEPEPPKEEFDWDLFLGPVPWRPYNRGYVQNRGGHSDLWAGGITEWGSHTFDLCQWANDSVDTSPVEYIFPNNQTSEGLVARYANGVKLLLTAGGFPGSCGARFEGTEGSAMCADGAAPDVKPASLLGERARVIATYRATSQRSLNHWRDFLDCVHSRRQATADADVAHTAHTICHAATICMHLGRDLKYDPVKEEFIGDEEANRMRSRAYREPWVL